MKKIIMYIIVVILVIVFAITFVNVFAFEKNKDNVDNTLYSNVDNELVFKLYSYILKDDPLERATMYSYYYTKAQNLNYDVILSMIYNYMIKYDSSKLQLINLEDLKSNGVNSGVVDESNFKALYKMSLNDVIEVGKIIFGKDVEIPKTSFNMSSSLKGHYLEEDGYLIYEDYRNIKEVDYIVKTKFDKYVITDEGNTLLIYDYYVKCDKNGSMCYDDDKRKIQNKRIRNYNEKIDLENNLVNAQGYLHKFVYEDGNYHWFSTELVVKK